MSDTSPEPSTIPNKKRKRKEIEAVDGSDDLDAESSPDIPVLSHAERRRQKKAAKTQLQEEPSKKRKIKDGVAIHTPTSRRQNSVWVGNMSFKTTQDNLRTFFEGVGEITRINMPTKSAVNPAMKPENRGFAYIDFATPEAKTAAIVRSEQPLLGRKLLIKDGGDYTGRPAAPGAESMITSMHSKTAQKILRAQKQPPAPTLFLGNLGFETTEQDIRQLFEAHRATTKKGKQEPSDEEGAQAKSKDVWMRKIRMGTFEDSGLCKGFAFVDFTSIENATASLINPKNHLLNGRKLIVEYAGADAVRRGASKPKPAEGEVPSRRRDFKTHGPKPEQPGHRKCRDLSRVEDRVDQPVDSSTDVVVVEQRRSQAEQTPHDGTGKRVKGPRVRPKPGAALALAKRESAAIVPSKGQKITF